MKNINKIHSLNVGASYRQNKNETENIPQEQCAKCKVNGPVVEHPKCGGRCLIKVANKVEGDEGKALRGKIFE